LLPPLLPSPGRLPPRARSLERLSRTSRARSCVRPATQRSTNRTRSKARRIEAFISTRIRAGDRKSEIKAKLVAQFGTAILAAPPRKGFDLIVWWLPIAGVLTGALLLGVGAWRWSRVRAATAAAAVALDPDLERLLDEELARF